MLCNKRKFQNLIVLLWFWEYVWVKRSCFKSQYVCFQKRFQLYILYLTLLLMRFDVCCRLALMIDDWQRLSSVLLIRPLTMMLQKNLILNSELLFVAVLHCRGSYRFKRWASTLMSFQNKRRKTEKEVYLTFMWLSVPPVCCAEIHPLSDVSENTSTRGFLQPAQYR